MRDTCLGYWLKLFGIDTLLLMTSTTYGFSTWGWMPYLKSGVS